MSPWEMNLRRVFDNYCADYKSTKMMDGKSFAKLAKDCEFLDENLSQTDVDITFSKIKDRNERRISYQQFQNGLALLAKKKGVQMSEITTGVDKRQGISIL